MSGTVELLAGDAGAAEREFRHGVELFDAMGETGIMSSLAVLLAEALHAQGRDEDAERLTERSEQAAADDDAAAQIAWRVARAKITAKRDAAEAEALARRAIELASATDFLGLQADALMALAEALTAGGRVVEADEALRQARALHERKGNLVGVQAIDDRLGALARP